VQGPLRHFSNSPSFNTLEALEMGSSEDPYTNHAFGVNRTFQQHSLASPLFFACAVFSHTNVIVKTIGQTHLNVNLVDPNEICMPTLASKVVHMMSPHENISIKQEKSIMNRWRTCLLQTKTQWQSYGRLTSTSTSQKLQDPLEIRWPCQRETLLGG